MYNNDNVCQAAYYANRKHQLATAALRELSAL
jgi:hypothetical protein